MAGAGAQAAAEERRGGQLSAVVESFRPSQSGLELRPSSQSILMRRVEFSSLFRMSSAMESYGSVSPRDRREM